MRASGGRAIALLLLRLAALALLVAPVFWFEGGLLESEATVFLVQYLHPDDGRSIPQKIFDPQLNDFDLYQARELSYAIDLVDARIVRTLLASGLPCFVSASSLASGLAIFAVHQVGSARLLPGLSPLRALLPLLLFASAWVPFVTGGVYYRSAKPALAPLVLAGAFLLLAERARAARGAPPRTAPRALGRGLAAFGVGLCAALLDRQGFLLVGLGAGIAALEALRRRARPEVAVGLIAAAAASIVYAFVVGPWLIHRLNGYTPSFEYQDLRRLGLEPAHASRALAFMAEQSSLFFGGVPFPILATLGSALILRGVASRGLRSVLGSAGLAYAGLATLGLLVMFAVMIARHPYVYDWVDHRLWYYGVPLDILLLFGSLVALERASPLLGRRGLRAVDGILVAMVILNVVSWGRHLERMLDGPWFPHVYHQSAHLKHSLEAGVPHPLLDREYRAFFDWWEARDTYLRAPARRP